MDDLLILFLEQDPSGLLFLDWIPVAGILVGPRYLGDPQPLRFRDRSTVADTRFDQFRRDLRTRDEAPSTQCFLFLLGLWF